MRAEHGDRRASDASAPLLLSARHSQFLAPLLVNVSVTCMYGTASSNPYCCDPTAQPDYAASTLQQMSLDNVLSRLVRTRCFYHVAESFARVRWTEPVPSVRRRSYLFWGYAYIPSPSLSRVRWPSSSSQSTSAALRCDSCRVVPSMPTQSCSDLCTIIKASLRTTMA